MSDGAASASFTSPIFRHLDNKDSMWRDQLTLTNIAREAWAHLANTDRISCYVDEDRLQQDDAAARTSVRDIPAIHMEYRLPWPVLLVLQEQAYHGYQAVFGLLLQLSRAEHCLQTHQLKADIGQWDDELRRFWLMRSKLLWFTSTLHSYLTMDVLEPTVRQSQLDLKNATDVDEMIDVHSAFMKTVLNGTCLNAKLDPIHECILDVLDLAIRLEQGRSAGRAEVTDRSGQSDTTGLSFDKSHSNLLAGVRSDFDKHLRFICGGLRAVARATSDVASAKWDMLAEALEDGLLERVR